MLTAEKEASEYYEQVAQGRDGKQAANWVITNLFAVLNKQGPADSRSPISADSLGRLLDLIADGTHLRAARQGGVRDHGGNRRRSRRDHRGEGPPADHRRRRDRVAVAKVVADNPEQVEQFRAGNDKVLGWMVGQVMKATQGKANPGQVNQLLRQKLVG